jgi:hypothetical protein
MVEKIFCESYKNCFRGSKVTHEVPYLDKEDEQYFCSALKGTTLITCTKLKTLNLLETLVKEGMFKTGW